MEQKFDEESEKYVISAIQGRKEEPIILEQIVQTSKNPEFLLTKKNGLGAVILLSDNDENLQTNLDKWLQTFSGQKISGALDVNIEGNPWGPYEKDLKKLVKNAITKFDFTEKDLPYYPKTTSGPRTGLGTGPNFLQSDSVMKNLFKDPKYVRETLLNNKSPVPPKIGPRTSRVLGQIQGPVSRISPEIPSTPPSSGISAPTAGLNRVSGFPSREDSRFPSREEYRVSPQERAEFSFKCKNLEKELQNAKKKIKEQRVEKENFSENIKTLEKEILSHKETQKLCESIKSKLNTEVENGKKMKNEFDESQKKLTNTQNQLHGSNLRITECEKKMSELDYTLRSFKDSENIYKREIEDKEKVVRNLENSMRDLENRSSSYGPKHYYGDGREVEVLQNRNNNMNQEISKLVSQKKDLEHVVSEQKRLIAKNKSELKECARSGCTGRGISTTHSSSGIAEINLLTHAETIRILQETILNLQKELEECKTNPPSHHPLSVKYRKLKDDFDHVKDERENENNKSIEKFKHLKKDNEEKNEEIAKILKECETFFCLKFIFFTFMLFQFHFQSFKLL